MTETDLRTHATDIHDQFTDRLEVTVDEIHDQLETLVDEYKVPADEARRSVVNSYLDDAGMDRDELGGDSEHVEIAAIDGPEQWVDVRAEVVELWDADSDAVKQVGLLGDETGTVKFTSWAKSDPALLAEGDVYEISNVVTDEYEGRFSVKLNSTTTIEQLDEEIEIGDDSVEIEGALVDVQSGSGLIKRCPDEECTRVLQNGRCSEHGDVEGEFDLRIKAVLDNGTEVHEVIFDRAMTADLTGIDLAEAKEMAMDALDTSVVAEAMREQILGQYYAVTGPTFRRYVLADDIERQAGATDPEATLIKARSI